MGQNPLLTPAVVLVVEGEALISLELAHDLSDMGLGMLQADSADEAIALMAAYPTVEILLTNVKTAGSMDGIRLAHHLRDRWPPIKIILASGMTGARFSDLPSGSIMVPKPYRPDDIKRAVSYLTGRKRFPPADAGAARHP